MNKLTHTIKEPVQPDAFRIDVAQAVQMIAAAMPDYGCESVDLAAAAGQILRQPVVAERDQPPFERATMDGIAVAGSALASGTRQFAVAGIQAAGQAALRLSVSNQCFEVMTGAVLPIGSDTVIPIERISLTAATATLEDGYQPQAGQFVHHRASDHAKGDILLEPGVSIRGPEMAILTAAGNATVAVARWPRTAIVSTGDELVDVGTAIADYQIRSSNDRALEASFLGRGCTCTTRSRLPDNPHELLTHIRKLHDDNDVLILSGGVSMGKYDYVPGILAELGVRVVFHKILQRPGLPMWFGVSNDHKPVFALPGNPVSTTVCCIRYVLPAITRAMGADPVEPEIYQLGADVTFNADLTWFLPVKLHSSPDGIMRAMPRPTNTSGDFIGLRGTDGFIELPRGQDHFPAGFAANLYRW